MFTLWLTVFCAASQTIIVTPILPEIGRALDVPEGLLGWLVSVYAFMLGAMALVIGPVSDRVGRRRILLYGATAMTGALLLHGLATSFESLLAVRAIAGAGGGVLSGAAVSYVGDYFPYAERGKATGIVMSGVAFGHIAGIPLGTILAHAYGFRTPFLMFAGVMVLALVLIWRVVPQPEVEREAEGLSVGGALRRYGELLRDSRIAAAAAVYFVMYFSLSLLVVYLPVWLTDLFGVSGTFIASLFFVGGFASVGAGPVAGALSDRIGRRPLILGSCLGLAAVAVALPFLMLASWMAYPFFASIMLLFAARFSPLQALLTELVPSRQRGSLMSMTIAIGQVGLGIGASVAGPFYASYGYASNTFLSAALILVMAFLVWRFLPEPEEKRV
jgi:predicted MFS family arabinose efflux permease